MIERPAVGSLTFMRADVSCGARSCMACRMQDAWSMHLLAHSQRSRPARRAVTRVGLMVLAGVALLWAAHRLSAGPALLAAVQRLGAAGVATVLALQLVSFVADAATLRLCAGRPLLGRDAGIYLRACVVAQAVNTFTPLGQLGEAFKARALSRRLSTEQSGGAVLRHNYLMMAGNCIAVAVGLGAGAAVLSISPAARTACLVAATLFLALAAGTIGVMIQGVGAGTRRLMTNAGRLFPRLAPACAALLRIELASRPSSERPPRLVTGLALTLGRRSLLVVEAVIILRALSRERPLLLGVLSQSSAQLIAWATSFVPGQLGTAEGGGLLLFQALKLSAQLGLAFELVRRSRRTLVALLGLAWL